MSGAEQVQLPSLHPESLQLLGQHVKLLALRPASLLQLPHLRLSGKTRGTKQNKGQKQIRRVSDIERVTGKEEKEVTGREKKRITWGEIPHRYTAHN